MARKCTLSGRKHHTVFRVVISNHRGCRRIWNLEPANRAEYFPLGTVLEVAQPSGGKVSGLKDTGAEGLCLKLQFCYKYLGIWTN